MVSIEISIADGEITRYIKELGKRAKDLRKPMKLIGELMKESVNENFERGGRPKRWPESERAKRESGQTLRDTTRLQDSISYKAHRDRVAIGTNVVYAGIHQTGGRINKTVKVRAHTRLVKQAFGRKIGPKANKLGTFATVGSHSRRMNLRLPARPFLVVQNEDRRDIQQTIKRHLISLRTG